jgi:hypothetical protein
MHQIDSVRATTCEDRQTEETRKTKTLPVQSELVGHVCPSCGSRRYSLVVRVIGGPQSGLLAARCRHCRELRELAPDELMPGEMT